MSDTEALVALVLGQETPPPISDPTLEARVQEAVAASGRTVVALDDDPTGVQTVHDIAVLARWDRETLARELALLAPLFFILTNSRSLAEPEAVALNREIAQNLLEAGGDGGAEFVIASRSDSTLRGHFPAETDALAEVLGGVDGVLICPAFFEGGRVTAGDVHFVREGERLIPASETEFARDATFGYRAATLPEWVAEKSGGRTRPDEVASITLGDIRLGGPDRVASVLGGAHDERPVIINALDYADLWTVVLGVLQAEAEGKRFLYRTAASFVRARAGITARPLLTREELLPGCDGAPAVGVVIVGSHVQRTTEQLAGALALPGVRGIEVSVPEVLQGKDSRQGEIARVTRLMNEALAAGQIAIGSTSRAVELAPGGDALAVSRAVSDALVTIVQGIETRPDFIIGKGGITSSDVGTRGLGAARAMVLGQVLPGVPVWRLGPESRFPGLPYVVFPGNVGTAETLANIVDMLSGTG